MIPQFYAIQCNATRREAKRRGRFEWIRHGVGVKCIFLPLDFKFFWQFFVKKKNSGGDA